MAATLLEGMLAMAAAATEELVMKLACELSCTREGGGARGGGIPKLIGA